MSACCYVSDINTHTYIHTKAGEKVFGSIQETGQKVDFIVVGPLDDERKKSTGMGRVHVHTM